MSNGTTATVTVSAGQTTVANLSLSGDPRFCHIAAPFLFATASSFVDSSPAGHLLAFREVLDRIRHAPAGELMLVVGHTDDVGGSSGNDQLSQRRADSVLAVLTGDVPVWENIFQTERSNAWGDDNFRTMLTAVTGSAPTQTEINQHRQLTAAGAQRRATLFPQYFNILLGNPAASPQINTLVPATLACGERHVLASGNHQPSRRTEVFFFRGSSSPLIDCDEYPNWLIPCQILPPATVTVTIAAVDRIQQGQVEQIQVTVDPSPLPLATNITLELSTTSGTGEAQFVSTNAATMEITQSEAVRVRAITQSSAADNIRMTARISGQPAILAQEDFTVAGATSGPAITLASPVVVVKKPHTNPARQQVTLGIDPLTAALVGAGTFTRSDDRIRFFDAAAGGTEITFSGGDNVFSDAQLNAGVTLFAEGERASAALDDVQLELTLQPTSGAAGPPATATMTAVELTLDIAVSRAAPGVDPAPLSAADKINVGRFVQVGDPDRTHERAMLIIRQAQPAAFNGELELTAVGANLALFADELPAAGQVELNLPRVVPNGTIPANGTRFFVEGKSVSAAARDARYQLGIRNLEADGDRVNITVVNLEIVSEPTAAAVAVTFVRFGLWDNAYHPTGHANAGDVREGAAEADNFIGSDTRKFHFRVRDVANTTPQLDVNWNTLQNDRSTNVDAVASESLTLLQAAAGSDVYISRAIMLVTDTTDRDFRTHSGLAAPHPDTGFRNQGQSNHRMRRALIDGFVRGEYSPQAGVRLPFIRPVFDRDPDERRRLRVRVIRYTNAGAAAYIPATNAEIAGHFGHADDRWNQVGLKIDPEPTVDRPIPAAAVDGSDRYAGSANNPFEQAALADLIPITPDNTLTVVFTDLSDAVGAAAYATVNVRAPIPIGGGGTLTLADRFFIFMDSGLDIDEDTLAHELHHVIFNRGDAATDRQFFTFNTTAVGDLIAGTGIVIPDVRIHRRVQNRHSADPNNDPSNDNIVNWYRRNRTARFPIGAGISAATATTGNRFVEAF